MRETPSQTIARCLFEWDGRVSAEYIITELAAQGFKIMAREPTEAMLSKYLNEDDLFKRDVWKTTFTAMWDAA